MLQIPAADQFGPNNKLGIPEKVKQSDWLNIMKNNGCVGCHQLGQASTRTIPEFHLKGAESHADAWMKRTQSGQAGENMTNLLAGDLGGVPYKFFGEWTERVAKGELPFAKPERPKGIERNIVVTLRDWHNPKQYLHDLIASDRRYPTVNANGPVYGQCEHACNDMPILDVVNNKASNFVLPTTPDMPLALGPGNAGSVHHLGPSAYWGEEDIWDSKANNHNSMFDRKGRIWLAATGHKPDNPDFCKKGPKHPSAVEFPLNSTNRRVTMYDPKTGKYTAYQTCFGSHHLQFGYDENETLWMSTGGGGGNVGWINTKMLDETGDIEKSQGWTALVVDTNGNGQRDEYTEPGQPQDPNKDMRLGPTFYAVMPSPTDGSIWGTLRGSPGAIVRVDPGKNPHKALAEIYKVPMPGFGIRGADIDKQGRVWASLASGHMGMFDRRLCKGPLNGPKATGDHCPEGWSFYQYPGPGFKGIGENSAEASYYSWVDQHNTFGLGEDIPMSTANLMDGLVALNKYGKMVSIRVPYPQGFYAKGFDGRIAERRGEPIAEVQRVPGDPLSNVERNGQFMVEHIYVQYFLPKNRKGKYPLLMCHGGGLTGVTYESTPDGRDGWENIFVRKGWDTYVSDAVERGRSGFASPEVWENDSPIFLNYQDPYERFRIGQGAGSWNADPAKRKPLPNTQFSVEAYENYIKQTVPRWLSTDKAVIAAYLALVDRVCPCVLLGHSQGGYFAFQVAEQRPDKIKAIVAVEATTAGKVANA